MPRFGQVRITGEKEVLDALKRLRKDVGDKILEKAIRKGANILKKEMSHRAPSRTQKVLRLYGKGLKKEIIVRKLPKRKTGGEVVLAVGPSSDAFYGLFVEFGTGPRRHRSGKSVGMMPVHPFARPAYDSKRDEIERTATKILKAEVEKVARRAAR